MHSVLFSVVYIKRDGGAKALYPCKIKLFADDVKVFWVHDIKSKSMNVLQICLDKISDWSIKWQLPISYSKCYSMHFGVNNPNTVYKFGNADIKSESDIKDLNWCFC